MSLCFVSDDLNHDAGFVYALQHELHKIISTEMPVPIKHIYYFSDNCGGQYKNFKIMINLTFHQQDFNRTATWVFFAASHGKSPCDGIGGTVKRCLTRESLSRPLNGHILTAKDAFEYCQSSVKGITFVFMDIQFVARKRELMLSQRVSIGATIPGTQSYHVFQPMKVGVIGYKRTAEDEHFQGCRNFFTGKSYQDMPIVKIEAQQYVACLFEEQWWVGLIENIDESGGQCQINFMHHKGLVPTSGFYWPMRPDICWVSNESIFLYYWNTVDFNKHWKDIHNHS